MRLLKIICFLAVAALAGCSTTQMRPANTGAFPVGLPDGRSVVCVVVNDNSSGIALSCDWGNAK